MTIDTSTHNSATNLLHDLELNALDSTASALESMAPLLMLLHSSMPDLQRKALATDFVEVAGKIKDASEQVRQLENYIKSIIDAIECACCSTCGMPFVAEITPFSVQCSSCYRGR